MLNAKNNKITWLSYLMAMLLVANIFVPYGQSYATGQQYTSDVLESFNVTVKQNDATISGGGMIDPTKPIDISAKFRFLIGEGKIQKTDILRLKVAEDVTLTSEETKQLAFEYTDPSDGLTRVYTVGELTFETEEKEGKKELIAKILFNGDLFDQKDDDGNLLFQEAEGDFSLKLKFNKSESAIPQEGEVIKVLEKEYLLKPPAATFTYEMSKKGEAKVEKQKIDWTIEVSAKKNGHDFSLDGYKLEEDLANVGEYIDNTFVGADLSGLNVSSDKLHLNYTFPSGIGHKATITFSTKIPEDKFFTQTQQTINNVAKLSDEKGNVVKTAEAIVTFTPKWIEKVGITENQGSDGSYNSTDRTITWTLTANEYGSELKNAYIVDELKGSEGDELGPLTLVKATWAKWDPALGASGDFGTAVDITPNAQHEYHFVDIDTKILLKIVTKVPNPAPESNFTATEIKFTNGATLHWDGGQVGTTHTATVGFNAIKKEHIKSYPQTSEIEWKTTIEEKQQTIPNLAVYEFFLYDKDGITGTVSGLPPGIGIPKKEDQTLGQRYVKDSFQSPNLKLSESGTITADGKVVGEWIKITGFNKNKSETYTTKTQVVDPRLHMFNTNSSNIENTAFLYSGSTWLNQSNAVTQMAYRVMYKEMMRRESIDNLIADINENGDSAGKVKGFTTKPELAFDYKKKAVVYRLSINPDGINFKDREFFEKGELKKYGAITFTDKLPDGWEFISFDPNDLNNDAKKVKFFNGTGTNSLRTNAVGTPIDATADVRFNADNSEVTFKFDNLNKPYVVLLKAQPKEAKLKEYFSKNGSSTARNHLLFRAENYPAGTKTQRDVTILSNVLTKEFKKDPSNEGALIWSIKYLPADLAYTNISLKDRLPMGLDLPTDNKGNIDESAIKIFEMELQANGGYTQGAPVDVVFDKNVLYNIGTRELNFIVPDGNKAYIFEYKTFITGMPGLEPVKNKVSLLGGGSGIVNIDASFAIAEINASILARMGGYINITKEDSNNSSKKLEGAKFALFNEDGKQIRSGLTVSGGKLQLRALPQGKYTLKEIEAPGGYLLDDSVKYNIEVVRPETGDYKTFIEGKEVKNNHIIIKNDPSDLAQFKITKEVAGSAADSSEEFIYQVEIKDGKDYIAKKVKADNTVSVISILKGKGKIALKDGESFLIINLPDKTEVTVEEQPKDYKVSVSSKDTAITQANNRKQKVETEAGKRITLDYVNTKEGADGIGGPSDPGGGSPPSPVRPDPDKPETIPSDKTPLGESTDPKKDTESNSGKVDPSSTIDENTVPKTDAEKKDKTKVSGAPKTGYSEVNVMFKNFLTYGTVLLLILALADEYSKKGRR